MITNTVFPIMKRMYVKLGGDAADLNSYITIVQVIKKIFVLLGGDVTDVKSYNTIAPILDKMVDIITPNSGGNTLNTVNIFIGDYHDSETQTVDYGVINKYDRTLVS